MVSRHSGPCHSGPLPSGPGLNVKMNFFFKMTFRPEMTEMGQGNGNGKFEIKMLPSHGWKRVLRPLRAQLLHNLMGSERKLPVSNRQVALQKALKIGPLLYHWVSHLCLLWFRLTVGRSGPLKKIIFHVYY